MSFDGSFFQSESHSFDFIFNFPKNHPQSLTLLCRGQRQKFAHTKHRFVHGRQKVHINLATCSQRYSRTL